MLEFCLFGILLVGLISFSIRLHIFNNLYAIQNQAYKNYQSLTDGMSLTEINERMGCKGKRVFSLASNTKYRWNFGKSVIVKNKDNEIVSFSEFMNDIENRHNYQLKLSPAFVEMNFENNVSTSGKAVALN